MSSSNDRYHPLMQRALHCDRLTWQLPTAMLAVTGPIIYFAFQLPDRFLKVGVLELAFLLGLGFFALFSKARDGLNRAVKELAKIDPLEAWRGVPAEEPDKSKQSADDRHRIFCWSFGWSSWMIMFTALLVYLASIQAFAAKTFLDRLPIAWPTAYPGILENLVALAIGAVVTALVLFLARRLFPAKA